ncbi:MAG: hypothetical protein AB7G06_10010 [Bdellovibrionales bacterium]
MFLDDLNFRGERPEQSGQRPQPMRYVPLHTPTYDPDWAERLFRKNNTAHKPNGQS